MYLHNIFLFQHFLISKQILNIKIENSYISDGSNLKCHIVSHKLFLYEFENAISCNKNDSVEKVSYCLKTKATKTTWTDIYNNVTINCDSYNICNDAN